MKRTRDTDFDGVALHGFPATFQFEQVRARRGTGPTRRQTSPKDVRHFDQLGLETHRARLTRRAPDVLGRSQKFWVRVTDVLVTQRARSEFREQGVANEPKLDNRPVSGAGAKTLSH
jgi:hypothetical protein